MWAVALRPPADIDPSTSIFSSPYGSLVFVVQGREDIITERKEITVQLIKTEQPPIVAFTRDTVSTPQFFLILPVCVPNTTFF